MSGWSNDRPQGPKAVDANGSNPRRESNVIEGATTSWSNDRPHGPKEVDMNGSNPQQESSTVDEVFKPHFHVINWQQ